MSRATGLRQGGGNLPYFLDSNVLIGYYFHAADAWGAAATEVFDDPEPNHTSTGVWAECFGDGTGGRCHTIEQGLVREFRRAVAHLKRAGSMDTLIVEAEACGWRTVPLLRSVAGLCREQPAGMLLVVKEQYEALCRQRRLVLEDRAALTLHARTEPYCEIWERFCRVIADYDDCEVILDAHHVATTISGMVLYTGDYRHIIANRDLILSETRLQDIRYLGDRAAADVRGTRGGACQSLARIPESMVLRDPKALVDRGTLEQVSLSKKKARYILQEKAPWGVGISRAFQLNKGCSVPEIGRVSHRWWISDG